MARPIAFSSMSSVFSFHILSLPLFGPLQAFEKICRCRRFKVHQLISDGMN